METRLFPRIAVELKVSVTLADNTGQNIALDGGKGFEATVADISMSGLCLIVKKYYLPKGTIISLAIDGESFSLKNKMNIKAEVKHCKNYKANTYKCGIMFTDISEECKNAIKDFIAKYDKRQEPRLSI